MVGTAAAPSLVGQVFPREVRRQRLGHSLEDGFPDNMTVTFSAALDFNSSKDGPLFLLRLNPLRLEKGCRLKRRFGPDRFLEILIPSTSTKAFSPVLKDEASVEKLIRWLTRERHSILGKDWAAFFVADAGYRKPIKEVRASPDAKPVFKERIHLFSEDSTSVCSEALRVKSVEEMLDWLLQFKNNQDQSFLKLFSRIQLGLSKTDPAVVLEQLQISHKLADIKSPTGQVMNDGIGRISLSIARKVKTALGLFDLPSAIQGRMGSAKGLWIVDIHDPGADDWIETYPSQRKWNCVQTDAFQRTLEVHSVSHELRSAQLNLQFLPVLEDRARDPKKMRDNIGDIVADDLNKTMGSLTSSISDPLQFRQWVHSNFSSSRTDRLQHQQVPFIGGLPKRPEDVMNFLLDGGFKPQHQKHLQDLAFSLQKQQCDVLKSKLNIRVGRSAYIYMVVDFWNVLDEGEVHVAFSSKFQDPQGKFSDVLLHGTDVLVARSPAHLPSDIQKVKAVFKTELRALKDVIVFSAKGNVPLADKLSGGDYDGDKAWVCWDPDVVDNFDNCPVPNPPDVSAFMSKDKTTFGDLICRVQKGGRRCSILNAAVGNMLELSFRFNMGQSLLGQCTNYKEKLCYRTGTVRDHASIVLSTLLGHLVDQSKQGIVFSARDWDRLRRYFKLPFHLDDPAYKFDHWTARGKPLHIIDHLKFSVVKKIVDSELAKLNQSLSLADNPARIYDEDLVKPINHFEDIAERSPSCRDLLVGLKSSLDEVFDLWCSLMVMGGGGNRDRDGADASYGGRVAEVYDKWRAISPEFAGGRHTRTENQSKVISLLLDSWMGHDGEASHELSRWSILKASMTFKLYHRRLSGFVFRIAGRQLQFIKALASGNGVPALVGPLMYASLVVDKRFVAQYVAMFEGEGSEYMAMDDDTDCGEE
jgi:hypothetical protein